MNNWYLLAAIPVFGLLVFVHELGHFMVAKWAGIRVEEFGFGFPPRIVGIRRREHGGWEVIWLNGRGREEDQEASGHQTPFSGTSGGTTQIGVPVSDRTIYSLNFLPIGGFVRMPGENGDMHDAEGNYDPKSFAAKSAGQRIAVLCAGVVMNVLLAVVLFTCADIAGRPVIPPVIGSVIPNTPAAQAGLKPGDMFLKVNGQSVQSFDEVQAIVSQAIASYHGHDTAVKVSVVVQHANKQQLTTSVSARLSPPPNQGAMGIVAKESNVILVRVPLWQAPYQGVVDTVQMMHDFINQIVQMIVGAVKPQIAGPVGIVGMTGQVAQSVPMLGWWPIFTWTGLLSLNLAIINILPFPALDGGRILLIAIELLRGGKRLKPEREGIINFVGMAVLLALMLVITVSDVLHWGG